MTDTAPRVPPEDAVAQEIAVEQAHVDRVYAELAKAMVSLPAVKGFECGSGFAGTIAGGTARNILPKVCTFHWEFRGLPDLDMGEIPALFAAKVESVLREAGVGEEVSAGGQHPDGGRVGGGARVDRDRDDVAGDLAGLVPFADGQHT